MGCQTATAQQIKDLKGNYVLAVKENQPLLAQAIREFFETTGTPGYPHRTVHESPTLDKGHGRLEERHGRVSDELDWLEPLKLRERWAGLKSVACIESKRTQGEDEYREALPDQFPAGRCGATTVCLANALGR
jgi:hypothetical protein